MEVESTGQRAAFVEGRQRTAPSPQARVRAVQAQARADRQLIVQVGLSSSRRMSARRVHDHSELIADSRERI